MATLQAFCNIWAGGPAFQGVPSRSGTVGGGWPSLFGSNSRSFLREVKIPAQSLQKTQGRGRGTLFGRDRQVLNLLALEQRDLVPGPAFPSRSLDHC
jgi:hypothetical protein